MQRTMLYSTCQTASEADHQNDKVAGDDDDDVGEQGGAGLWGSDTLDDMTATPTTRKRSQRQQTIPNCSNKEVS